MYGVGRGHDDVLKTADPSLFLVPLTPVTRPGHHHGAEHVPSLESEKLNDEPGEGASIAWPLLQAKEVSQRLREHHVSNRHLRLRFTLQISLPARVSGPP